jgi:hypothetical protein
VLVSFQPPVSRVAYFEIWPAKQMLAGAVQCTPASDPKPDSFSAASESEGRPEKLG